MVREPVEGLSRRAFITSAGAAGAVALAGCTENTDGGGGGGGSDGLSGEVIVTGSSTVFPISDTIAEQFMESNPEVNVTVDATGSGGGFENNFCPGDSDINAASRPITDAEMENCTSNGVEPAEFQVASDALTVVVNKEADWVDCMTFEELSQIWRADGAETWSDVRDEWPDEPLDLYGPASTSGTFDWFRENVVGEEYEHTADHEPTEDDNLIVQGVEDSQYAMGYLGFAYFRENSDRVKAVNVKAESGDECVEPTLENARSGSYPMTRPLFIYVSEQSLDRPEVAAFTEFYLENSATDLVSEIGYVPVNEEQRGNNLDKLDELTS